MVPRRFVTVFRIIWLMEPVGRGRRDLSRAPGTSHFSVGRLVRPGAIHEGADGAGGGPTEGGWGSAKPRSLDAGIKPGESGVAAMC